MHGFEESQSCADCVLVFSWKGGKFKSGIVIGFSMKLICSLTSREAMGLRDLTAVLNLQPHAHDM